jgi:putative alpha-1,2-mannosidase
LLSEKLNGIALEKPLFSHEDVLMGGALEFEIGAVPNTKLFN